MKTSAMIIVMLLTIFVAGGCALAPQKLLPSTDPSVRKSFLGFFVQPPDGHDWFVQEQGPNWITYIKRTEHKEKHTVIATAMSQAVDIEMASKKDFLGYVEKKSEADRSDSRYRAVTHEISSLNIYRAECARVDFTAEDHGVPYASGST